jgi:histidinol-phosphatase (PHP family)
MMLVDYHLHTDYSIDGHATAREVCERALAAGVGEIAITDHLDSNPSDEGAGLFKAGPYFESLRPVQAEFAGRLTVRIGVEIGEPDEYRPIVDELGRWPFDVVIGSVHYIGPRGVHGNLFDEVPLDTALRTYFDMEYRIATSGLVDILAHLDYFQRYTRQRGMPPFDPAPYEKQIRSILEAVIRADLALEVNTSGVRQKPGVCFPDRTLLTWYYQMGGRAVTTGSDAHFPEHVGANLVDAVRLLRQIGFDSVCVFEGRKRRSTPLPPA